MKVRSFFVYEDIVYDLFLERIPLNGNDL